MNLSTELAQELKDIGITNWGTTLPELFSWLKKAPLLQVPPKLHKDTGTNEQTYKQIHFSEFTQAMAGSFGVVYLVQRDSDSGSGSGNIDSISGKSTSGGKQVFCKMSPQHNSSLLMEAILQCLSSRTLRAWGFPRAVPRVLDIVQHPDFGTMFTIERTPGAKLFADFLKTELQWGIPSESNDRLVLAVIAQVATYLAILESELRLNHRDLKGTNVLMVAPSEEAIEKKVILHSAEWTFRANHEAILIDFGFACLGKESGELVVSAGDLLPEVDFCPKEGRDLFLFFASLWNIQAFRKSVTYRTESLFTNWLRDRSPISWAQWLVTAAETNLTSMYLLTNSTKFRSRHSAPQEVLKDIALAQPDIVQFYTTRRPPTPIPYD